eukprot:2310759-Amphidinium_carterae.2
MGLQRDWLKGVSDLPLLSSGDVSETLHKLVLEDSGKRRRDDGKELLQNLKRRTGNGLHLCSLLLGCEALRMEVAIMCQLVEPLRRLTLALSIGLVWPVVLGWRSLSRCGVRLPCTATVRKPSDGYRDRVGDIGVEVCHMLLGCALAAQSCVLTQLAWEVSWTFVGDTRNRGNDPFDFEGMVSALCALEEKMQKNGAAEAMWRDLVWPANHCIRFVLVTLSVCNFSLVSEHLVPHLYACFAGLGSTQMVEECITCGQRSVDQ